MPGFPPYNPPKCRCRSPSTPLREQEVAGSNPVATSVRYPLWSFARDLAFALRGFSGDVLNFCEQALDAHDFIVGQSPKLLRSRAV